jgi:hypothetical protein
LKTHKTLTKGKIKKIQIKTKRTESGIPLILRIIMYLLGVGERNEWKKKKKGSPTINEEYLDYTRHLG